MFWSAERVAEAQVICTSERRSKSIGDSTELKGNLLNIFSHIWQSREDSEGDAVAVSEEETFEASVSGSQSVDGLHRFLARQPIFDLKSGIFAYELLFRTGWENCFRGESDAATRMMVDNWLLFGFGDLTQGAHTFLNCTRESLVEGLVTLLPKSTVLELLETIEPDEEILSACRTFKAQGYQIALDDFQHSDRMEGLVELADYIKIDFRLSDRDERRNLRRLLAGSNARLVAEKVETAAELKIAIDEGFELFQGYFFCRPTVFSKRTVPTNGVNYLRLLAELCQSPLEVRKITELVKSEASICFRLLRMVNSVGFGVGQEVRSIQSALVLVGDDQFRKLAMVAIVSESCKGHPEELLIYALQRARFLELLALYSGQDATEQYLFGLFSLMGTMLNAPMETVIDLLPLRAEVKSALLGKPNEVGTSLRLLESYVEGEWRICAEQAALLGISEGELTHAYIQSLEWAQQAVSITRAVN